MLRFIGFCFVAWFMITSGIAQSILLFFAHILATLAAIL